MPFFATGNYSVTILHLYYITIRLKISRIFSMDDQPSQPPVVSK